MFLKKILYIIYTVFVTCKSDFVDNLVKCKIDDGQCQRNQVQTVLKSIAKTGIPELGVPQIDPLKLTNISVSVLNSFDITLIDGAVNGIKNCIVDNFVTNIDNGRTFMEVTCDLSVKGHYKVKSSSPVIKNFFGGQSVHGDGNGKVKIEKMHLKLDFRFFIQKRNGEHYLNYGFDKTMYSYDIGKMTFFADNFYLGNSESSKLVTELLNQNWRILMDSFGKSFMDRGMNLTYGFIQKVIDTVPIKYFIEDDLSNYAEDE